MASSRPTAHPAGDRGLTAIAAGMLSLILIKHLSDSVSVDLFIIALAFLLATLAGAVLPSRLGGLSDRFGRRPPLIIRCRAESLPKISGNRLDSM